MEMKPQAELTPEARDQAALYVLGGMRTADVPEFEEHLDCLSTN